MTSEELLSVLQELADNQGDCLYDWEQDELLQLYELARRLTETARDVLVDLVAQEDRAV